MCYLCFTDTLYKRPDKCKAKLKNGVRKGSVCGDGTQNGVAYLCGRHTGESFRAEAFRRIAEELCENMENEPLVDIERSTALLRRATDENWSVHELLQKLQI